MLVVPDTRTNPLTVLRRTPMTDSPVRGLKRVLEGDESSSDTNHQLGAYSQDLPSVSSEKWERNHNTLFASQNVDETIQAGVSGRFDDMVDIAKDDSVDPMTEKTPNTTKISIENLHHQVSRLSQPVAPSPDSKRRSKIRFFLKLSLRSRQLCVIEKDDDDLKLPLSTFKFTFEMPIPPRPALPVHRDGSFRFHIPPPPKIMLRIKIPIGISLSIHMSKKMKLI
ncbi:hypothetical protein DL93DRAFT_2172662 [Clavulina sp. PMI_390]|nr:hypothetical protein DL93DRAFT_2172662 [Clavulina sp. PMI_390]